MTLLAQLIKPHPRLQRAGFVGAEVVVAASQPGFCSAWASAPTLMDAARRAYDHFLALNRSGRYEG